MSLLLVDCWPLSGRAVMGLVCAVAGQAGRVLYHHLFDLII